MTERTPTQEPEAPAVPARAGEAAPSIGIADQLAALRAAAGEADALAAAVVQWFDEGDWSDADPVLVDHIASLLGLMAKTTTALIAEVEKFHGLIADAQPAPGRDQW